MRGHCTSTIEQAVAIGAVDSDECAVLRHFRPGLFILTFW